MSDELKHECAVALVVLRKDGERYRVRHGAVDYGGVKLSLLMEKQRNRGQDGAGAAVVAAAPMAGVTPYRVFRSAGATSLADVLGALTKRSGEAGAGRTFLGHLRYATFGKNDVSFCHPFVHASSELGKTLLLAGNFNLTNAAELFDGFCHLHCFPTSRADGYLMTELVAHGLEGGLALDAALANALSGADGAWTLIGATADGTAFATRDPHGIRPGWYYVDDDVVAVASERAAIQAAFDVATDEVKELPRGEALIVSPTGEVVFRRIAPCAEERGCVFERIYFSRANDADIHRERKALGAALAPSVLKAARAPMERIFFSCIPNSARIAFHGLLERLVAEAVAGKDCGAVPRFGEIAVKDAKFRTFIADAAVRREFYRHVYDVTYGLVGNDDTLVVVDDSIVRGNTMKNAILPMLARLGPKRIVIASSAPPIRYPDCYGIDMSTLGELVAFRALVNLLGPDAPRLLREALESDVANPLAPLYARFTEERHAAEIARLLTPPEVGLEVAVVYQSIAALHEACPKTAGDWYFTGDYPTPGGYRVLRKAIGNYLDRNSERPY